MAKIVQGVRKQSRLRKKEIIEKKEKLEKETLHYLRQAAGAGDGDRPEVVEEAL